MKIESSNVTMQSTYKYEEHSSSSVKFEVFHGLSKLKENAYKAHVATELLLSNDFRSKKVDSHKAIYTCDDQMSLQDKSKKQIIGEIVNLFFNNDKDIFLSTQNIPAKELENSVIEIETKEEYYQKQTIDFNTSVQINTAEKNYSLDLEIAFSKELYEVHNFELTIGDRSLLDPLVINYGENINPFDNLSKLRFEFDLNNDGENELIPLLKEGAGFLAFDQNENGIIDNGYELFGPKTNNGFEELSQYDIDQNNWIDENDTVFDKLKVWQINENKENKLISLIDLNIGAIYLGEVQSGFSYQDNINEIKALQKSNGIYVKNDGSGIGMINSLDIAL